MQGNTVSQARSTLCETSAPPDERDYHAASRLVHSGYVLPSDYEGIMDAGTVKTDVSYRYRDFTSTGLPKFASFWRVREIE